QLVDAVPEHIAAAPGGRGKIEQRPVGVEDAGLHADQRSLLHAHHRTYAHFEPATGESRLGLFTRAFRLAETEFAPAGVGLLDVVLLRPHRRRETGAAVIRYGPVVEIHGGVDQHPAPFTRAEH